MKKIFAIILGALLVMGFAASAFAIHAEIPAETQAVVAKSSTQITLGGELRIRGWYRHNSPGTPVTEYFDDGSPETRHNYNFKNEKDSDGDTVFDFTGVGTDTGSAGFYDYRVRLNIEAKVSPNVMAYVQLESTYNDATNSDKWTFGGTEDTCLSGCGNLKPDGTPDFLQAWMLYTGSGLFGFPSGLKIGHMPLKLAYGQFFDHTQLGDDAIVFFMDPTKQWHIGLLTVKFEEGKATRSLKNTIPSISGSSHPNNDDLDGYVALTTYKWNDQNTVGANFTYLNQSDWRLKMSNLGIHGDGKFGNFGYQAALDLQFGSVGADSSCGRSGHSNNDFGGWAFTTRLNYKINNVNLRGAFGYGSGQDDWEDEDCEDIEEFVAFDGNGQNIGSFIMDYLHRTPAFDPSGFNYGTPGGNHSPGIANTTFYNLGVDWQATKDLSFSFDGYLFRASDVGAWEDAIGCWDRDNVGIQCASISKNAGWEIDAKMKYNVAKNLVYQIDIGYLNVGDFYKDVVTDASFAENYNIDEYATIKNNIDDVWVARHMLTLSF